MKANELRIGNITDAGIVCKIYPNFFYVKNPNSDSEFCSLAIEVKPIPLTEEWFLNFGFTKNKLEGYDTHFKYLHFNLNSGITALYNSDFSIKLDDCARGIKYVHQLQNLYFALTGQELEHNEKSI
jgi:hypothetical protein